MEVNELEHYLSVSIPHEDELDHAINAIKVGMLGEEPLLVAVDEQGLIVIWFILRPQSPPLVFNNLISTWGIALHTDQRLLAASANDHIISIYDLKTGQKTQLLGHDDNIPNLDFNQNGDCLVSCSIDGTIRLWDVAQGNPLGEIQLDDGYTWSCTFVDPKTFIRTSAEFQLSRDSSQSAGNSPRYLGRDLGLSSSSSPSLREEEEEVLSQGSARSMSSNLRQTFSNGSSPKVIARYILATSASGAFLLEEVNNRIRIIKSVWMAVPDYRIGQVIRQFDRLNMVTYIPQLSLALVASQKGRVSLFRFLAGANGVDPRLHRESTLPESEDTPVVPLLGHFVVFSNLTPLHLVCSYLYLIYYDGTMMCFQIEYDADLNPILATEAQIRI